MSACRSKGHRLCALGLCTRRQTTVAARLATAGRLPSTLTCPAAHLAGALPPHHPLPPTWTGARMRHSVQLFISMAARCSRRRFSCSKVQRPGQSRNRVSFWEQRRGLLLPSQRSAAASMLLQGGPETEWKQRNLLMQESNLSNALPAPSHLDQLQNCAELVGGAASAALVASRGGCQRRRRVLLVHKHEAHCLRGKNRQCERER